MRKIGLMAATLAAAMSSVVVAGEPARPEVRARRGLGVPVAKKKKKVQRSSSYRFRDQSQQDAVNCVVKARNRRERRDAKRRADYVESIVYNLTIDVERSLFLLGLNDPEQEAS